MRVDAVTSKVRNRRVVNLPPCAVEWLTLGGVTAGYFAARGGELRAGERAYPDFRYSTRF